MNLLLVNPIHPATPHISATRAWRFAQALARRGHRVVLLTATFPGEAEEPIPPTAGHDWRLPLVLPFSDFHAAIATSARRRPLRKLWTAWQMLRHGGHQRAWAEAALVVARRLSQDFRPDAIWTTFGRMEAVVVARRIARELGVPWVLDVKDSWEIFVPNPLRSLMARRIRGWHAITTNSMVNAAQASRWLGEKAHIVYSGVDQAFIDDDGHAAAVPVPGEIPTATDKNFILMLVGSLYFEDRLTELLRGIAAWAATLPAPERGQVVLRYAGGDVEMFERLVEVAGLDVTCQSLGYLPVASMAASCRNAAVNMYIAHEGTFHHKLLELLACGRPVLAFPREGTEAHSLAARLRGELIEPGSADGIIHALRVLHRRWAEGEAPSALPLHSYRQFSWDSQARLLEGVLADATTR